jgi:flavin reductase (DIM6/NTAB) family NADH-FMN oxidoreductase RutF
MEVIMFDTTFNLDESCHPQPRVVAMLSVEDNLMPLSWHMPISKEPFIYAVSMRSSNFSHELIMKKKAFALNFLDYRYVLIHRGMGDMHGFDKNKFQESGLTKKEPKIIESALIEESYMIYECELVDVHNYGDHDVFISKVACIHNKKEEGFEPTLFLGRGRYETVSTLYS